MVINLLILSDTDLDVHDSNDIFGRNHNNKTELIYSSYFL